jgi:branched-chain amino acid transport system substrate-binding protein
VAWYIKEVDLLHQIKEKHGFTKMFISIDDSAMCRGAAEIVKNLAVKDGWEAVGFDKHPIATTDYSVALTECKKSGAQVLFIWAYSPETSIMIRQWADMEVPALPIGFIGAEDPAWEATKERATPSSPFQRQCTLQCHTLDDEILQCIQKRWNVPPRSTGCQCHMRGFMY